MAHLDLTFLGAFQARLNGKPLAELRGGRVQNLLAYLVLEASQPQTRAVLAALFWPDEPEPLAKQSLRQVIYQLRRQLDEFATTDPSLQPFLLVERDTLQFNPASDYTVDVLAFQAHLKQQQWAEAAQIYQGELLSGLSSTSAHFEEWLLLRREQLHIQALAALDQLTQQALQAANLPAAQEYARRQLALEPWHEAAHRQLMLALARNGDRSMALAQYEACRRILAEELAVEPDAETMALVAKIRKGDLRFLIDDLREPGPKLIASSQDVQTEDKVRADQQSIVNPKSKIVNGIDWGEAPDITRFHGRQHELAELERWLTNEQCRLVSLLGMGGIGKTSLAVKICQQVADKFEFVIWRSLLNAPPLGEILQGWQQIITGPGGQWPDGLDAQLALIFTQLRQCRCLLVLDNAESIMQGGRAETGASGRAGYFRAGYEEYEQLLKRMGETSHRSCLLLTSREQPQAVVRLERTYASVRSLPLIGLTSAAGQAILQVQGVRSDRSNTEQLIERYSGNPLALMLVAETIEDLFDGDVAAFLQEDAPIFDDIRDILGQQFARLTPLEQDILRWLALEREPLSAQQLDENFPRPVAKHLLLEALTSLRRRSLIEKTAESESGGFTLQNVVTEYITDSIIEQVSAEIEQQQASLLKSHALLKAQAREYVRQSQERLLLHPITARLRAKWGQAGLVTRLCQGIESLRQQPDQQGNYGGGNLLNLLIHAGADLRGLDLSHLAVWQAHLKGVALPAVNFTHSDLKECVFTGTFGAVISLDFSPDGQQLAAGTTAGQIHLWQVHDGQATGVLAGHTSFVFSVFFMPDNHTLVSGSDDQLIRLWAMHELQGQAVVRHTMRGHTQGVWRLALSQRGDLLASVSGDRTVCLWDLPTGQLRHTLRGHKSGIRSVAISPDGTLVASGDDGGFIRLWRTQSGEAVTAFRGHMTSAWSLAFHPHGQWVASGSRDHTICIWRLTDLLGIGMLESVEMEKSSRAPVTLAWRTLTGHTHFVTSIAFSPDGTLLASGSFDQSVRVWDVAQGLVKHIFQGHSDDVNCVAFSPDGATLASGSNDRTVRLWDAQRGYALRTLQGHMQGIMAVALSPTTPQLAAACLDHTVQLWPIDPQADPNPPLVEEATAPSGPEAAIVPTPTSGRGREILPLILSGHRKEVHTVAFGGPAGAAGTLLASGSVDHNIHLWDSVSGKSRLVLSGHQGWLRLLCFTPDGNHLISCSNDWTIRLWDVRTGECIKQVETTESVWAFALLPNQPWSSKRQLLVSGGTSNTARLWDLITGETIYILHGHTNWVVSVAISPDGKLLATGSADQTVRIWDLASGELQHILTGHGAWVYTLAFAPDVDGALPLLASGSADQSICLWNARTGELLQTLHGHTNEVRSVAFVARNTALWHALPESEGPLLISGSTDETLRVWAVETGRCLQILRAPRPYERMNITNVTGITDAQKIALKALGAVEQLY